MIFGDILRSLTYIVHISLSTCMNMQVSCIHDCSRPEDGHTNFGNHRLAYIYFDMHVYISGVYTVSKYASLKSTLFAFALVNASVCLDFAIGLSFGGLLLFLQRRRYSASQICLSHVITRHSENTMRLCTTYTCVHSEHMRLYARGSSAIESCDY
jgi:hypothetical protein